MKKITLIIVIFVLGCIGCSDDFLNIYPISSQSTGVFYKTETDFEQAVNGTYAKLNTTVQNIFSFLYMTGTRSDDVTMSGYNSILMNAFIDDPDIIDYQVLWGSLFSIIQRANTVISNSEGVLTDQMPNIERIRGEAFFLRAVSYFYLVRFWGGMPLYDGVKTLEQVSSIPRSTIDETYNFIIKDLEKAEASLLSEYPEKYIGKATSWAAKGFLAKVLLYTEKHSECLKLCNEIVSSPKFEFIPNWYDLFKETNDNGSHVLFQVQCKSGGLGFQNKKPTYYTAVQARTFGGRTFQFDGAAGSLVVSEDAYFSFENGDLRRDYSIIREAVSSSGDSIETSFIGKFTLGANDPFAFMDWGSNITLLRFTDILLMKAECINEIEGPTSEATAIIDMIRNRVNLPNISNEEKADKNNFFNALVRERRHEMMFEHQRWFDLNRWGMAEEVINTFLSTYFPLFDYSMKSHQALYPIPYEEIEKIADPVILGQNPGW